MTGPGDEPGLDFGLAEPIDPEATHGKRIDYGKYKGQLWTRVPLGYLRHLANTSYGDGQITATAELKRRGYGFQPELEVSGHAVDRASLKLHMNWQMSRLDENEGIHSWLKRIAGEAYAQQGPAMLVREAEEPYDFTIYYQHTKMIFSIGHHYPTLKTIMPKEDQRHGNIRISRRR